MAANINNWSKSLSYSNSGRYLFAQWHSDECVILLTVVFFNVVLWSYILMNVIWFKYLGAHWRRYVIHASDEKCWQAGDKYILDVDTEIWKQWKLFFLLFWRWWVATFSWKTFLLTKNPEWSNWEFIESCDIK